MLPLLSPGDIIIDGGNSHFTDTDAPRQGLWKARAFTSSAWACRAAKKGPALGPA
ncbi:MAG: hypothetical protein WKG07_33965 [Hymenobacter sp.]